MELLTHATSWVGSFAAVNGSVQEYLRPIMFSLVGLAGVVSTFFIILGGIQYTTSSGKPERLEHAKKVLRNALLGLVIVIAAGTLTAILTSAYQDAGGSTLENVPALTPVDTADGGGGITEILINAIIGLFKHIINTAASPFINALDYFTQSTPLMADNPAVFKLWLTTLGIANALLVGVLALLGFHVMSAASLGLDEIEFKHLLPKVGATFLLMNMSIFAIDAVISLSNVMIDALRGAYEYLSVWDALSSVASTADGQGLVALLVMVVFMILAVILLVYYVTRIVTLYVGAVLAPVVILLQLIPGFKDFASTALRAYVTNIFILFVHVVILTLAATIFEGLRQEGDTPFDPVMTNIVGIAALLAVLKTQGTMMQMSYVSGGPRAMRKLGTEFMHGVGFLGGTMKAGGRKLAGNTAQDSFTPRNGGPNVNTYRTTPKPKPIKEGYK